MAEYKIIGLSAPAGFSINEHLQNNPANKDVVSKIEKQIIKHIKSCYEKGDEPIYSEWYAGMTDKTHHRYNAHKKERKIDELPYYKKFYLFTMSNARNLEAKLFKKYGMGNSAIKGGIYINSKYVYVFHEPTARLNGFI
jgi:hypothetical protein